MTSLSRLKWQCRRGMRELDELLLRFLETRYGQASEAEKRTFRDILALSDPELNGYLLQRQTPDCDETARVIQNILNIGIAKSPTA